MRIKKKSEFESVSIYRLGWSPVGNPLMTVCLYVIDNIMIDTGQPHMKKEALEIASVHKINRVLLTHHHEDHAGNAGDIQKKLGARVSGHELTSAKMISGRRIMPYQYLVWGRASRCEVEALPEYIEHGKYRFENIYTPGHAKDHTVYLVKERGWLFSGDLYLGNKIKYFRSDEQITDQIESLRKAINLDFETLFCGHNPVLKNGKKALSIKLSFMEDLYGKCQEIWKKGIPLKTATKELGLREASIVKFISFGNASLENIIASAYRSFEKQSDMELNNIEIDYH